MYSGWGEGLLTGSPLAPFTVETVIRKIGALLTRSGMTESKRCTRCDNEKPLVAFSKNRRTRDGLNCWCRKCCGEVSKIHRSTPAGICQQIKGRNKFFKDHPFVITQDEFIMWYTSTPRTCVYCSIPEEELYLWKAIVGGRFNRLTVDCKDNDIGYMVGNLVLACDKCNVMKGDVLTYEEMRYVGEYFIRPKWERVKRERRMRI